MWDSQLNYFWFDGELMLNQGVTASIDVGQGEELSLAHREAVNHGKIRGPRTFTGVGHFQAGAVTGLETALSMNQAPKTPEEARTLTRKFLAAGADVIMFHDGKFSPDVVAAGCDEAHKAGKACSLRAGGPKSLPADGAAAGVDFIPHAQGVSQAILKDGARGNAELDRYADMDEAKAKALIALLVQHHVALVPNLINIAPTYAKDAPRFLAQTEQLFADPALLAYYPAENIKEMRLTKTRMDDAALRDKRVAGYRNMLRFYRTFDAAGGHVMVGGDTNPARVAGPVVHEEMEMFQEAGIPAMRILQGATQWPAEAMHVQDRLGSVTPGKLADIVIVNADPLKNIANLRDMDTLIFDGKVADRGFHASYGTVFMGAGDDAHAVENLAWTQALKAATVRGGRAPGGGAAPAPDPFQSPQLAIEQISPVVVTAGAPTTLLSLKGFNFVAQSRVYFDGVPVPYTRVSATELQVLLDENLLRRAGRFDIVVKNPDPAAPLWGDGTSNKAHLLVDFKY